MMTITSDSPSRGFASERVLAEEISELAFGGVSLSGRRPAIAAQEVFLRFFGDVFPCVLGNMKLHRFICVNSAAARAPAQLPALVRLERTGTAIRCNEGVGVGGGVSLCIGTSLLVSSDHWRSEAELPQAIFEFCCAPALEELSLEMQEKPTRALA